MPHFIPPDCQSLLRGMIEVDAARRLTVRAGGEGRRVRACAASPDCGPLNAASLGREACACLCGAGNPECACVCVLY